MRKSAGILCLTLLVWLLGCAFGQSALAEARTTVRVAYFDLGDYYVVNGDAVDSYDLAYLNKVSEYTHFKYEFVDCGTWANALAMLENHEVDLVGTVQWNPEREEQYEFCLQSYGYTIAELASLPESGIVYEDYAAFDHDTIGYVANYVRLPEMQALFAEQGISPTLRAYPDQQSLEQALYNGEVDIIAANSHTMRKEWDVVERFCYTPYYFASWKGNTALTDAIDEAITQIAIYENSFVNAQVKKYLPSMLRVPLSKAETDVIARQQTYTVYFDADTKPLVWLDEEGEMRGTIIDLCGLVQDKTGLQLQFKPRSATDDRSAEDDFSVAYHTFTFSAGNAMSSGSIEEGYTAAVLQEEFSLYYMVGTTYQADGSYTIAVPSNRSGAHEFLTSEYPNCTVVEYDTPEACLTAVSTGRTNLAFLCDSVAETSIIEHNIRNVSVLRTTTMTMGIGFRFRGADAPLLADIMNKGVTQITSTELKDIQLHYALETKPDMTLGYIISQHMAVVGGVVLLIIIIVCVSGILAVRNHVIRRENQKIEAANRAKTDFFSRMSHDMRTPMNGILGIAGLSRDETDPAVLRENIRKIETSGKYLLDVINDTLDLQRIESGKMTLEPTVVVCRDVIESALDMVRPAIAEKHIDFRVVNGGIPMDSVIRIDQVRMKQIFVNLVSNAIKFTPEGGTITFEFDCLHRDAHIAHDRFIVRDTGVGMSETFVKEKLFTPFAQEHNQTTEKYAGSGLGLSIVKRLVDLMGGRIEVESELGSGTAFIIELDVERVDQAAAAEATSLEAERRTQTAERLAGCRILLAEDHPLNAEIAQKLLCKVGCVVTWVKDGQECVDRLTAAPVHAFDVILMDIRMPVMDGLTATRTIRAMDDAARCGIPIIAMTANAYSDDVAKCLEAGMNAHIAKPIEPPLMYQTIANVLTRAKAD